MYDNHTLQANPPQRTQPQVSRKTVKEKHTALSLPYREQMIAKIEGTVSTA